MGSLVKGFLRKVCGNSAENCREMHFIAPGKGAEILRKVCGNLPNDHISELLKIFEYWLKKGGFRFTVKLLRTYT